jgi:hypothetical protein
LQDRQIVLDPIGVARRHVECLRQKQLLRGHALLFHSAPQFFEQDPLVRGVLIHQNKAVRIFHQDIQLAEHTDDLEGSDGVGHGALEHACTLPRNSVGSRRHHLRQEQHRSQEEGERPDEPQLPLYTLAQTVAADAVAFAHVRHGDCGFVGLAAQGGVADGVTELARSRYAPDYADWPALLSAWWSTLERLAVAFRSGAAPVVPKKRSITCRNCDLHTLCRVSELADRGSPIAPAEIVDE